MVFFISWSCMVLHSVVTSHKSILQFSSRHVLEWLLMQLDPLSKQWVPSVSFRLVERWPWEMSFYVPDSVFSIHHAYLWILVIAKENPNHLVPNLSVHESSPMTTPEDSDGQEGHWPFLTILFCGFLEPPSWQSHSLLKIYYQKKLKE